MRKQIKGNAALGALTGIAMLGLTVGALSTGPEFYRNTASKIKNMASGTYNIARSATYVQSLQGIRTPGKDYLISGDNRITLDRYGNIVEE
jgi:hypothetical protein